jgi:hypothetical protein
MSDWWRSRFSENTEFADQSPGFSRTIYLMVFEDQSSLLWWFFKNNNLMGFGREQYQFWWLFFKNKNRSSCMSLGFLGVCTWTAMSKASFEVCRGGARGLAYTKFGMKPMTVCLMCSTSAVGILSKTSSMLSALFSPEEAIMTE